MVFVHRTREETPNDPKLSDGGGWRGPCMVGGKAAAEARAVTAVAVRCSAWLGVAVECGKTINAVLVFGGAVGIKFFLSFVGSPSVERVAMAAKIEKRHRPAARI